MKDYGEEVQQEVRPTWTEAYVILILIGTILCILFLNACTINVNVASEGQPVILNVQDLEQIKKE